MSDAPIQRHPHAAARNYDGEAFIVVPGLGEYNILNSLGSRVWELIDGTRGFEEIVDVITAEYEVSRDEAQKDVTEFLDALREHQMIS